MLGELLADLNGSGGHDVEVTRVIREVIASPLNLKQDCHASTIKYRRRF
jgi:hypothetical protein